MLPREITNRLMLLLLLSHVEECKNMLRLQSIVFQIEVDIRKIGWTSRTFNYKFIRWYYGAYSKELSEDIELLRKNELIENNTLRLTEKAKEYLHKTREVVENLHPLEQDAFFKKASELNGMELESLLLKIYEDNQMKESKMGKIIEDVKYAYRN